MYTIVLIEPRIHKALDFVIRNALDNLDEHWDLLIFHGTTNKKYLDKIVEGLTDVQQKRISFRDLWVDNLDHSAYQALKTSIDFYKALPTEICLFMETDSMIIPKIKDYIYDFLQYDYVGAPWSWKSYNPLSSDAVGNGGLSLRKRSAMISVLEENPYRGGPEDIFISKFVKNKPSLEEARRFSMETILSYNSFGIHKPWNYIPIKSLKTIIPNIQELIDLQDVETDFEGKKYFVLDPYNLGPAGIGHMGDNLKVFFAVARKTGRIIILPYFSLEGCHNFGKKIKTNFLEYYDLSQESFLLSLPDDATPKNTYSWRPSNRYNLLNRSDKLIINFKQLHINNYPINFSIKEKAQIIIDILPKPFISVHVRRGDYLTRRPSAYKTTQTVYILNKILKIMRKNPEVEYKSVYIYSNEENLNYFNSLKTIPIIPKVYTVIDFPELIEQRKTDNYVLYLMEKCIEDAAQNRISTWKTGNPYYSENLDETFGYN